MLQSILAFPYFQREILSWLFIKLNFFSNLVKPVHTKDWLWSAPWVGLQNLPCCYSSNFPVQCFPCQTCLWHNLEVLNSSFFFFFFFFFLRATSQHTEGPRLGVESELQLLAYATATATWDPSHICDLHHSSWQRWILNPLSKAGDQTCVLMDTSRVR